MTLNRSEREDTVTVEGTLTLSEPRTHTLTPRIKSLEDEGDRRGLREEQSSGSGGDHVPKATSKASSSTRVEKGGERQSEVPKSGSSGDQVPRTKDYITAVVFYKNGCGRNFDRSKS